MVGPISSLELVSIGVHAPSIQGPLASASPGIRNHFGGFGGLCSSVLATLDLLLQQDWCCHQTLVSQHPRSSATMANEHILKVPRGDDEGSFIMLNIKSNGIKPLDIALLATDGESAWASSSEHYHLY